MPEDIKPVVGMVLTGGGARAAYQAGVIRYISELYAGSPNPVSIFSGSSAGAINVVACAAGAGRHDIASKKLWDVWLNLHHDKIFEADMPSLALTGGRLLFDLIFGGNIARPTTRYLLNTKPLHKLLQEEIVFSAIRLNLKKGHLKGVAISATNYLTGTNITFYDAKSTDENWVRSQRVARPAHITIDHLMASAAIPVFFPPVQVDGSYYGDGSVRLTSPLSAAIHIGAEKIIAIGIRHQLTDRSLLEINRRPMRRVYMADIAGLLMNSVFADSLESDIERCERVNRSLKRMSEEMRRQNPDRLRHIDMLTINPSVDLGELAAGQFDKFPPFLKYLLRGIGVRPDRGGELISYLSYDSSYTAKLLELGYEDARKIKGKIESFIEKDTVSS